MGIKPKYVLSLLFNLLIFYALWNWLDENVSLPLLLHAIQHIKLESIIIVAGLSLCASLVYALRLKILIETNFWSVWSLVCIGNGLNNILPFRLGDAARIFIARERFNLDMQTLIAASLIERYSDLAILLLFGFSFGLMAHWQTHAWFRLLLLVLLACGSLSLLIYRAMLTPGNCVREYLHRFAVCRLLLDKLAEMTEIQRIARVLWSALWVWSFTLLIYYVFFRHNLSIPFDLSAAIILCLSTTLAFAIPYMIAGIGVFESAIFYVLVQMLHVNTGEAIATALIFHLAFALPQLLLMVLAGLGLTWQTRSKNKLLITEDLLLR